MGDRLVRRMGTVRRTVLRRRSSFLAATTLTLAVVVLIMPAPALSGVDDPQMGANDFRISEMGPDGTTSYVALEPAVAYNPSADEYLVVWSGYDNTAPLVLNEYEVFGQRIDATTGAEIGGDFRISDMGPDGNTNYGATEPAVVYNSAGDEYLVVWWGDDDTGLLLDREYEVFGQRINATTGAEIGGDFRISDMGPDGDTNYGAREPAVAYGPTADEYLVVWSGDDDTGPLVENEQEIFGQRINATTGTEIGGDFRISDMGPDGNTNYGAFLPSVVYNSAADGFLVVWSGDDNTGLLVNSEYEVFGQRIDATTGAEIGGDFRISDMGPDGNTDFSAISPSVVYNSAGDEYLVVWWGDDDTGLLVNKEYEVFGQRINATTGAEIGGDFRISDMGPDGNTNYSAVDPSVAYNPSADEYLVMWEGEDDTAPLVADEEEIFGQRIDATTGAEIGDNDFRISDMGPNGNTNYGAFEPAVAYSPTDNQYLVVWYGDDNTPPLIDNEAEIFGQRLQFDAPHDVGLVDTAQGIWRLKDHKDGSVATFTFGNPGDRPVVGDWDGDGDETPGLFRDTDGFFYGRNSNDTGIADFSCFAGNPSDVALGGDWDGDGIHTLGIYRPTEQVFYLYNKTCVGNPGPPMGAADVTFLFGNPGDTPAVGDWDDDGKDEVGLYRESTGFFYWRNTLDTGIASDEMFFGNPGDRFVAGDWGLVEGTDTPAVFRGSITTFFFRQTLTQGVADSQFVYGETPWLPVAGTFGLD